MKDYQQKRMKSYVMPQTVYRQALWAVKDLERLRNKLAEMKQDAYVLDGFDLTMPSSGRGGRVCDVTGSKAVEIANLVRRIEAIELAFMTLPQEYRRGIEEKLVYGRPYDQWAHSNTWKHWQQVFLYHVAVNLQLL